ncbi:hypothetical protein CERZMDRAFT_82586 [Cercospora zeae-maydis SCOH1-5]|uniref:Uncharacterized protein n=1 Tax=Cercospora zeae-maydis SCOH1-5 TaxID=717836 RepID=A0A6A6FMV2_9PEZI|nr:hypothetical protein CERZMDRAFT_82586 [Cercospora zeae-maydis SCOH1-5]
MSPGRLSNRIAIVTGSSSGLGRAIALQLAAEGAKICCVDLYEKPRNKTNAATGKADDYKNRIDGETTVQELHRLHGDDSAIFVHADMIRAEEVENAVAKCKSTPPRTPQLKRDVQLTLSSSKGVEKYGRIDILCNNAGISIESTQPTPLPIHQLPESDWDLTMTVNVKSVFLGSKYVLARMLTQPILPNLTSRGWIINTASVQGLVAYYNTPAYTASKGAVAQVTKQIALDYAPYKIHCNSVCPGFLRTAMTQNLQNDPAKQREIDAAHPLGGMGSTADVAKAVLFLASDDCAWVTGVNLPVDGGYMIT